MITSTKFAKIVIIVLIASAVGYIFIVGSLEATLEAAYAIIPSTSVFKHPARSVLTLEQKSLLDTIKADIYEKLAVSDVNDNPLDSVINQVVTTVQALETEDSLQGLTRADLQYHVINDLLKEAVGCFNTDYVAQERDRSTYFKYIIEHMIIKNKPLVPAFTRRETGKKFGGRYYSGTNTPRYTFEELTKDRLKVAEEKLNDLRLHHQQIVDHLRQLPLPPRKFFKGKGIVIMSSREFLPGALVTIGQLRELGSKLPIEVVLDFEADYDADMCEKLLPKLNTKCVIIERELTTDVMKELHMKGGFQLKALGILVSTFDHTILLDADNVAVKNFDKLFESAAYKETKFILWPDLWHRGISPSYYDITETEIGELVDREGLPNGQNYLEYLKLDHRTGQAFSDFKGVNPGQLVESGQMVFSKNEHFRSLVLALYYNVYGESHYYALLYQGTFGVGDRETFLPALAVMKEPYFFSAYTVWLAGFFHDSAMEQFQETTIVQYDPDQVYFYLKSWRKWLKKNGHDTRMPIGQANEDTMKLVAEFSNNMKDQMVEPDIMFLHMHRPKINPIINAHAQNELNYEVYTRRNLGKPAFYSEFGANDWELHIHTVSKWVACEFLHKQYWDKIGIDQKFVCDKVSKYVEFLKQDTKYPDSGILNVLPNIFEKATEKGKDNSKPKTTEEEKGEKNSEGGKYTKT
ncbi:uncharacterized protein KQ657_000493 [Scheffersomyces spartinae]|uniref:Uncharacterized protein n=1 Tax=Scheffersomyces spartinae TaxID=45513 RepID=A0A9P8AIJ5_9ASCO|nr:uncharacterized protein KQ657_000493 [Scheffersomyces spartinae]KAG7193800.1 hypothetical protein KQ657_000493 [Scheffersomyces spartinae]